MNKCKYEIRLLLAQDVPDGFPSNNEVLRSGDKHGPIGLMGWWRSSSENLVLMSG